jgi:hypothetical protein
MGRRYGQQPQADPIHDRRPALERKDLEMKARRLILMAVLVATAAWLSAGSADAGGTPASGQVVFYPDVANLVPGTSYNKQVPSVRPSLVLMFQDGSWVIKKLRWSSWGGPVARASGISSASNCKPNCAQGKRTNDAVQFVLSQRRHLFGRTVYACYQLTDPKAPPIDQRDCLKHSYGSQYYYSLVAGSPLHLSAFLSPDRKIWCVLNDTPGVREADCFYDANRFTGGQEYSANLRPNGQLVTCAWQPSQSGLDACVQNWDPSAAVLKSGKVDVIYQYHCQATRTAITCTVDTGKGKGKGFTITDTGVTPIP